MLHLLVWAAGFRGVITHIFDAACVIIGSYALFNVTPALLRAMEPAGDPPARVRFHAVLAPEIGVQVNQRT